MLVLARLHIRALSGPVEHLTPEAFSAGIFVAGRVKFLGNCDVVRVETPPVSILIFVSVSALPVSEEEQALFWPTDVRPAKVALILTTEALARSRPVRAILLAASGPRLEGLVRPRSPLKWAVLGRSGESGLAILLL